MQVLNGKRRCPVCFQLRTANDTTPDGSIHRVLDRSNRIWCPYADNRSILEDFEREQKERQQAAGIMAQSQRKETFKEKTTFVERSNFTLYIILLYILYKIYFILYILYIYNILYIYFYIFTLTVVLKL